MLAFIDRVCFIQYELFTNSNLNEIVRERADDLFISSTLSSMNSLNHRGWIVYRFLMNIVCILGKCCFDGCALSCISNERISNSASSSFQAKITPPKKSIFHPGDIAKHNKAVLSSLVADCPDTIISANDIPETGNCTSLCKVNFQHYSRFLARIKYLFKIYFLHLIRWIIFLLRRRLRSHN